MNNCWILLFSLLLTTALSGQNKHELEHQRKTLLKDIKQTNDLLRETHKNKEAVLTHFYALQRQITKREQLINVLKKEIELTHQSITRTEGVVAALQEDIGRLYQEYSIVARKAYRMKLNNSTLLFLFSSGSLNDAFFRWQYLKQYDAYRKKQAYFIIETQKILTAKIQSLKDKKNEKQLLLETEHLQKSTLQQDLAKKNKLLKILEDDENKLLVNLKKQQASHEQLNSAIESTIIAQSIKNRKKERTNQPSAGEKLPKAPSNNKKLSANFYKNKGKLPWPVDKGIISKRFGKQPHPTLKKIEISNNGIDILTNKSAEIFTIFEGEVSGVQFVPGHQNTVIIRHGNYYTVYSNLEEVFVQKGDKIPTKHLIGKAMTKTDSQKSEVHLEIWKEQKKLNPVRWISRR